MMRAIVSAIVEVTNLEELLAIAKRKALASGGDPTLITNAGEALVELLEFTDEHGEEVEGFDIDELKGWLEPEGLGPAGNENAIAAFFHCALCMSELDGRLPRLPVSPREYQRLEVGWTAQGFQVWCRRHDVNVMHVDFEGQQHPANITRKAGT